MFTAKILRRKFAARGHRIATDQHDQAAFRFRNGHAAKHETCALAVLPSALMKSLEAQGASRLGPVGPNLSLHVVIFEIYEHGGIWSVLRDGRVFGNFPQRAYAEDIVDAAIQRTFDGGGRAQRLPTVQSN